MSAALLNAPAANWQISCRSQPSGDWDAFIAARPSASVYLQSGWALLAREVFGHEATFIEARSMAGELLGVLPLVRQKSFLLGTFATSLPFFNYGGAECDDPLLAQALMEQGRAVAQGWACAYVEFRDSLPRPGDWIVRTDKVTMILDLPSSFDALSKQLGSKLRSQVKRVDREQPSVRHGGEELLRPFYDIFAENMRDLGTPVYPAAFFQAVLRRFPRECRLLVVDRDRNPAAAAFLVLHNGRAEIPWAACRAAAKPLGFNMKLYWEVLKYVIEQQCTQFDFGRSTINAGTYNFKRQWGAKPVQLYWHRWERRPRVDRQDAGEAGALFKRATLLWQKLPLQVANRIGPLVSPSLPW